MGFMVLIPIMVFIAAFFFIASIAFSSFKRSRKTANKTIPIIEQRFDEYMAKNTESIENQENKMCEYCGSHISNDATKCDSCGAKVKK